MTTVFVTGTGTGVGKTWWTATTARALRDRGVLVAARKPAQSFDPSDESPSDADTLAAATGEGVASVIDAQFSFACAMAPPMAADALGRPRYAVADLVAAIAPTNAAVTLIEGAGGVRSPIAHDGDNHDLACALDPDILVLVAAAELGAVNMVRLSIDALCGLAIPVIVALNHFDPDNPVQRANLEWLGERDRFTVVTTPDSLADRLLRFHPHGAPTF